MLLFEKYWSIDEYISELATGCYFVKEYSDIALNEIKLQHIISKKEEC